MFCGKMRPKRAFGLNEKRYVRRKENKAFQHKNLLPEHVVSVFFSCSTVVLDERCFVSRRTVPAVYGWNDKATWTWTWSLDLTHISSRWPKHTALFLDRKNSVITCQSVDFAQHLAFIIQIIKPNFPSLTTKWLALVMKHECWSD